MRRLVVAIIAVSFALMLAGCGGGGSSSTAAPPAPAASTGQQAPPTGAAGTAVIDDRSVNETATFKPFPAGTDIPAALAQMVTVDKQPTIIFFYDPTQNTSKEVRAIIDTVRNANRGMVELVTYDVGKYVKTSADGAITVDPALSETTATKQAVLLARNPDIDVTLTPFIVITDGQGYIIYKHRGLIDKAFLEREVRRAAR